MFDSVLGRGNVPQTRFGAGTAISVVTYVGLGALMFWISSAPPELKEPEIEVTFKQAMAPPPPPPPPPPKKSSTPKTKPKVKKPEVLVQPKEIPQQKPPETEPEPQEEEPSEATEEEVEGGVEGGVVGGVVGGVLGGVLGGEIGGTGTTEVVPFGEGMERPVKLSGRPLEYTREALEARVEGLMIVKCVINTEGKVDRCRIIKPVPHMEKAVLDSLYSSRYKPVTFQGRPVQVDYTFNIRLQIP